MVVVVVILLADVVVVVVVVVVVAVVVAKCWCWWCLQLCKGGSCNRCIRAIVKAVLDVVVCGC